MRSFYNRMLGVMAGAFFVLCLPLTVLAEGTTTIHVSSATPSVGDTLSVTVTATSSASMSLAYNADVLSFSSANTDYTTDGNTISFSGTNATVSFSCISSGKSNLIVTSQDLTGSSASVQVSGASASEDSQTSQESSTTDTTSDIEGQFVIDGVGYVVSERYSESEIPSGFSRTAVTIDGYSYRELSNGTITLLYLKPASDTSGSGTFYVYDEASGFVSPFSMVGTSESYVILATPESLLSDRFVETTLVVEDASYTAYTLGENGDFFFLYGTNESGVTGWFSYDSTDGSIQRLNEQLLATTDVTSDNTTVVSSSDDEYLKKWQKQRYFVAGLLFVVVVLAVIIINLLLGRRRDSYEDPFDEDEDAFDEGTDGALEVKREDTTYHVDVAEEKSSIEHTDVALSSEEEDEISAEEISKSLQEHVSALDLNGDETAEVPEISIPEDPVPEVSIPEVSAPEEDSVETLHEDAEDASASEADDSSEAVSVASEKKTVASDDDDDDDVATSSLYSDIKGTEAFRSKDKMHYKTSADETLDIIDLNDL